MAGANGTARPSIVRGSSVPIPVGTLEQFSRSDTYRYSDGRARPDEYAPRLINPQQRMQLFEEMRSDDAVNTPLTAREQLIQSANWVLATEDDSPQSKEILQFCEDNIYPLLDAILYELSTALQYGFAAIEPCYIRADRPVHTAVARGKIRRAAVSTGNRIYLEKIARIRQRSVWAFMQEDNGDLRAVEQYVFTGGVYGRVEIPPEKLILWTYRQRGDDRWGYPPTRNCYKAWDYKSQLERLQIIGFDRFGAGTPVITAGDDWTTKEYDDAFEFAKRLRVGGETALITPPGATATLIGGEGSVASAFLETIKWYTLACAKTFLTQGTELGSTQTGARALGETMYDQMEGVVQADCEQIAQLLTERLIVPLVQWNFGEQKSYPAFNPSQRVRQQAAIAQTIATLIEKKAVQWDAEDENWLRDQLGLHDIDVVARQAEMDSQKVAADAAAQAAQDALNAGTAATQNGNGTGRDGGATGATLPLDKGGSKPLAIAATRTFSAPDPAAAGRTHRTSEYSAWESSIVKPVVLGRELDVAAARLTGEVQAVLHAIDFELATQVELLAADGHDALAQLDSLQVPPELRNQLRTVILAAVQRAYERGATAVGQELERQRSPDVAAPSRFRRIAQTLIARSRKFFRDPAADELAAMLRAAVERAVQDECDRREASARSAAMTTLQTAPAATPDELRSIAKARAQGALEELSPARTQDNVAQVVNAGFGAGRRDAIDTAVADTPDDIAALVYSAVLDLGTCSECARWDGATFPADYDQDAPGAVKCPNPRCAGGSRCRCIWVAVMKSEAPSIVPPSRGPVSEYFTREPIEVHVHNAAPAAAPAPNVTVHVAPAETTVHAHIEKSGGVRTTELTNARGEKSTIRTVEE